MNHCNVNYLAELYMIVVTAQYGFAWAKKAAPSETPSIAYIQLQISLTSYSRVLQHHTGGM